MLKVLVIDDSALMRRLLSQVLTEAGIQVAMARNGREGVEQVTEWQPDVVTLDINMPAHPWHPSVDRMVETALRHLPAQRMVGVLLTGMGNDGAEQMARLRQMGGRTIAESADTAVVFGMPQELINRQGATQVLPCHAISAQLVSWMGRPLQH